MNRRCSANSSASSRSRRRRDGWERLRAMRLSFPPHAKAVTEERPLAGPLLYMALLLLRIDPRAARLRGHVRVVATGLVVVCRVTAEVRIGFVVRVVLVLVVGVDDGGQARGGRRFDAEVVEEDTVAGAERPALADAAVVDDGVHRRVGEGRQRRGRGEALC